MEDWTLIISDQGPGRKRRGNAKMQGVRRNLQWLKGWVSLSEFGKVGSLSSVSVEWVETHVSYVVNAQAASVALTKKVDNAEGTREYGQQQEIDLYFGPPPLHHEARSVPHLRPRGSSCHC